MNFQLALSFIGLWQCSWNGAFTANSDITLTSLAGVDLHRISPSGLGVERFWWSFVMAWRPVGRSVGRAAVASSLHGGWRTADRHRDVASRVTSMRLRLRHVLTLAELLWSPALAARAWRPLYFTDVSLLFFSPQFLRRRKTDIPETFPHDVVYPISSKCPLKRTGAEKTQI